ncbi:30S ribosomal protein S21, chloroplastic [Senna tora]|uniref:30S ribosomal protein S21, chloroplastic n=1 Tax=Senna tora TaxID=362788 RepID=A0A834SIV7_9FABA|nr:30S ribosomal protein S21, chloroplastic [Senna tora]
MAVSSSFFNFLSFLSPAKPSPPKTAPPSQLNFPLPSSSSSSSSARSPSQRHQNLPEDDDETKNRSASAELSSVMCPSLAFSNTMLFKSAYNVQVLVGENESEERLLNRFRREVMKTGLIQECKRRRFFENKQDEKKRKTREAAKRNRRRPRFQSRFSTENKADVPTTSKKEEEEDNWDLPEEDTPY